jgi:hypothetical protein
METKTMIHPEVINWIEEYHADHGHIPSTFEIMHGCSIGYSWATVCRNDYENSLVAKLLSYADSEAK